MSFTIPQPLPSRINVVGTSGSGKTTIGRRIAGVLRLPFHELDALHWQPGWQETPREDLRQQLIQIVQQDAWVLDGNYDHFRDEKWRRVQMVVWIDLSLPQTLWQVTKRTVMRSLSRKEIWPNTENRETMARALFTRDSILRWALTTHRANRRLYSELMRSSEYAHLRFVRLASNSDTAKFLTQLQQLAGK